MLLAQERVRERGERGGPKGQEPTRFGNPPSPNAVKAVRLWYKCGLWLQVTGRRVGAAMTSDDGASLPLLK